VSFFVKYIPEKFLFGTKTIWRNNVKVQISDPYKTVLDIVDDPVLGAGAQHMMDCLSEFKKIYDKQSDIDRLLAYAIQIDNGALFKKLGFLAEQLEFNASFIEECSRRLTTGYAYLDKSAQHNQLITKWRLWVPKGQGL
jgi:predicted transcriptional regulator of viral defense system